MDTLDNIQGWFCEAKPEPTLRDLSRQIGCHLEEVAEMLEAITFDDERIGDDAWDAIGLLADRLKSGEVNVLYCDEHEMLDSTRDQCVTGVGIDYMLGSDSFLAQKEVNRSNWSKFVDGKPVFDEQGKIAKGPDYTPPDLSGFVCINNT